MSSTTPKLGLFKYDTSTDGKEVFSIQTALNNNWDIIDNMDLLPDQTGKSGYLLTTDGSVASWGETGEIYPIVETYVDGTSWYRVWSDGWCEQGGIYNTGGAGNFTIYFSKTFVDTNYIVLTTTYRSDANLVAVAYPYLANKSTSSMVIGCGSATAGFNWQASGYIEV